MKKIVYLFTLIIAAFCLNAQEINFDELPDPIKDDLIQEESMIDSPVPDMEQEIPGEEAYYAGPERDIVTDTVYFYHWNRQQETWMNHHRKIRTIDGSGLLINLEIQHWSPAGEWKNGIFRTFLYNPADRVYEITTEVWHPGVEDYVNYHKTTKDFLNDTILTDVTLFKWHHQTQAWANRKRLSRAYDGNYVLISDTSFIWRPFQEFWTQVKLNEYSYDSQGYRTENLTSVWDPENMDWKQLSRALIHYSDGMRDTITHQFYFPPDDEWKNKRRTICLYDSNDNISEIIDQKWFFVTGLWGDMHRKTYSFNNDDKIEEVIFQAWNPVQQVWKNRMRDEFTYDASGSLEEKLTQKWHHFDSTWVNFKLMQIIIDYKTAFAGTDESGILNRGEKIIFTNPGTANLPVSFESLINDANYQFRMYSLHGTIIEDVYVSDGDRIIPSGNPAPGIYVVVLYRDGVPVVTEKMMISR